MNLTLPSSLTTVTTFSKFLAGILFIGLPFLGLFLGMQYKEFVNPSSGEVIISTSDLEQETSKSTNEPLTWKTYTNTKYGFSIEYPSDWTYREFPDTQDGAAFRPLDKPNDYQYEFIDITVLGRPLNYQKVPFDEYVREAAVHEIQNYESLSTIKKVTTADGLIGYKTTWKVSPMPGTGGTGLGESLPRTYFDYKNAEGDTLQVSLGNLDYLAVYDHMIESVKIVTANQPEEESTGIGDTKSKSTNPNLKTYTSSNLGVSFTYLETQNGQKFTVNETGNKICISYGKDNANCDAGQSVEVFQKGENESLDAAIRRIFLAGKDPKKCLVDVSEAKNYPSNFVQAEITYPEEPEFDLEKMEENLNYCSSDYGSTNGIRYFLEDKSHPTKFMFFSIGQYGISSENDKPWQETITVN